MLGLCRDDSGLASPTVFPFSFLASVFFFSFYFGFFFLFVCMSVHGKIAQQKDAIFLIFIFFLLHFLFLLLLLTSLALSVVVENVSVL